MKNNLIFYKTTAAVDNTGEVLIYKSLLELLRPYGHVIVDDKNRRTNLFLSEIGVQDSERLSNNYSFPFILSILFSGIQSVFSRNKVYFFTGTGQHTLKTGRQAFINLGALIFCLFMRCCDVRVVRIGMSMEIEGFLGKLSERLLSYTVRQYFVRDTISLKNCHNAGVKKVQFAPDLSWAYMPLVNKQDNDKNKLLLVFRDFRKLNERQEASILDYTQFIIENNPLLTIGVAYQVDGDEVYAQHLYDFLIKKLPNKIEFHSQRITLENAHKIYGVYGYVLTNRLHSALLSYKFGALPIPFLFRGLLPKIEGIFSDAGVSDLIYFIDENTNFQLPDYNRVKIILGKQQEYSRQLNKIMHEIFQQKK
jgi:polysaccharide pyruvyl transferase WcaK-like protein